MEIKQPTKEELIQFIEENYDKEEFKGFTVCTKLPKNNLIALYFGDYNILIKDVYRYHFGFDYDESLTIEELRNIQKLAKIKQLKKEIEVLEEELNIKE